MKPKVVTEVMAQHRARQYLARNDLIAIRRQLAPIGPIFVLSLRTGRVVAKNIESHRQLAQRYGLVKAGERV